MNLKTFFIGLLFPLCINAQQTLRCLHEPLTDPDHLAYQAELEILTQNWIKNKSQADLRTVYTIPVVVHIVYHDLIENIPDQQVYDQIEVLNEDFRQLNANRDLIPAEFQSVAADVEFEFCLVSVDTGGNATSGITRTYTPHACIGNTVDSLGSNGKPRLFYSAEGGQDIWDSQKYLNLYVANTCDAFLGRARLPGTVSSLEDAPVIDTDHFGSNCGESARPFHLGRTATHEVGHFFNLQHVFGVGTNCTSGIDDGVADTPFQSSSYIGCPDYPQFSCNSSDMFMNFMDFVDDACMLLFTTGQKNRMLATLTDTNGPRKGLIEDSNLCAPPATPPDKDRLIVAPNPPGECLYFDLESDYSGIVNVRLFDAMGQLIYQLENNHFALKRIETRDLASGVYFLVVAYGDELLTEKILVVND